MHIVYVLKSNKKQWFYVGSTNNLVRRLSEHDQGKVRSTKGYRPFELVFIREFENEAQARAYEKKLKDCRREKENLLRQIA